MAIDYLNNNLRGFVANDHLVSCRFVNKCMELEKSTPDKSKLFQIVEDQLKLEGLDLVSLVSLRRWQLVFETNLVFASHRNCLLLKTTSWCHNLWKHPMIVTELSLVLFQASRKKVRRESQDVEKQQMRPRGERRLDALAAEHESDVPVDEFDRVDETLVSEPFKMSISEAFLKATRASAQEKRDTSKRSSTGDQTEEK